jgi:multiple sugar transport system permease protein
MKSKGTAMTKMNRRDQITGFLMACLPFVGFLIFSLYPMALSLVVSFFELKSYDLAMMKFVGFENYEFVFTNQWVRRSVINTLEYCLSVPINITMALFLANLFMKPLKGVRFGAAIAYLPTVCSVVSVTLAFQWIFEANYGVVNTLIDAFGGGKINFMGDARYFMPAVLTISVWMKGTNILQLQSALANVDQSLKEAAQIDGANGAQVFFKIVLPSISPTLFYVLVMWLVAALQEMTVMQLISNNGVGPDFKAMTITYYIYRIAITNNVTEGFGRASALSWVFAIAVMIISRILFKLSDKFVTYD